MLLPALLTLLLAAPAGAAPRPVLSPSGPAWLGTITPTTHPRVRGGRTLVMVDPETGALHLEQVDIALPGSAPAVAIHRVWDDAGWRTTLDDRIVGTASGVELRLLEETLTARSDAPTLDNPMAIEGPVAWPEGSTFTGEAFTAKRVAGGWEVQRGLLKERYDTYGWLLERLVPGSGLTHTRELDRLTSVESRDGRSLEIFHNSDGDLSLVKAPEGFEVYYDHQEGVLEAVSTSEQGRTRYTYDDDGLISAVIWPDGTAARIRRDDDGRVSLIAGPGPLQQSYQWSDRGVVARDGAGGLTQISRRPRGDEGGHTEVVTDSAGRTVRTVRSPDGIDSWTDPRGVTWRLGHNDDGDVTQLTAASGTWRFGWSDERMVSLTQPSGGQWTYRRDLQGRVVAVTSPAGRTLSYPRNGAGQVIGVSVGGAETRLERDLRGRVTGVTTPGGARTDIHRDALGRVTKIIDPGGHELLLTEHRGLQAGKLLNRDKHAWTMQFDAMGRPTRLEAPSGEALSMRRSSLGRVEFAGVAFGAGKRYRYRPDGRLTAVEDALGASTGLIYDATGRMMALRRPDLSELKLLRDPLGELVEIRAGDTALSIQRDSGGRPVSVGPLTWAWNLLGQLIGVEAPGLSVSLVRAGDGSVSRVALGEAEIVLERDSSGRVVRAVADDQTLAMERDSTGLVTRLQIDENLPLVISRDTRGLVVSMSEALRSWRVLRDGEGRALKWTSPDGTSLSGPRDAEGRPELVRYPDGTLAKHTWDIAEDTWSLEDASGRPLMTRQIDKDLAGRPTRVVANGEYTTHVRHDPLGQLVALESDEGTWSWTSSLISGSGDGTVIALDAQGLPQEASPPQGMEAWGVAYESLSYLRDDLGRVSALMGDAVDATLEYDLAGRLTAVVSGGDRWAVEWDLLGRPLAIRDPDGEWLILQFGPDGLISWRSELEGLVDVLHAEGWGWLLSGDLSRLVIPDETGAPRAFGYETYEPLSWTPLGFPKRYWSSPVGWRGTLTMFAGGPLLDGGGAWDPVSGSWVDSPALMPWAREAAPTGDWPSVDGTGSPWWDPAPFAPETIWSDPLALLVAMGELEPAVEGDWLVLRDAPAALPWLPAASATPDPPLCPPLGALPIDLSDSPLSQLAVRSAVAPVRPIDTDAVIDALAAWEFAELKPLRFAGPGDESQRPWLPPAALLR